MTDIRVFILTTDGPVEVQRITEEDPGVKSVICLDGKAIALPVSPAYEAFVRAPTGVVERSFGHPAYRLDVSGRITEGLSWQFGVFLAHALHAAGRLGGTDSRVAVLTTGEVDRDLNVLPVESVPDKLMLAGPLVDELTADGVATTVLIPQDNGDAAAGAAALAPVATVGQAFEILGLEPPDTSVPAPVAPMASPPPRRRYGVLLTVITLIAAGLGGSWWLADRDRKTAAAMATKPAAAISATAIALPAPPPKPALPAGPALVTTLVESRAPPGKTCAAVHFKKTAPRIVETAVPNTGRFPDTRLRGLCALAYRITNKGTAVDLTVLAARGRQDAPAVRTKVFLRNQRLGPGERTELTVQPPRARRPLDIQFLLLAATDLDRPRPATQREMPRQLPVERWRTLPAKVAQRGFSVFTVSHRLSP